MPNSSVVPGLVPVAHSAMREDLSSPIQGLPSITRVRVCFPPEIYRLLEATFGGPPDLMNALLPSYVLEVQINNSTTGVYYRGPISDIQPVQNHFHADAVFNGHLSPRDTIATSQFHENMYPPNQAYLLGGATAPEIPPTDRQFSHHMEYTTQSAQGHQIQHPGSYGFESALRDLKDYDALQVLHPSLAPVLPSTMPICIPSASSSTTSTPPFSAHPPLLGGSVTLPKIPPPPYHQVSHHSESGIQSAHGHQIQQPGCPRAYVVDGLSVDEEDLINQNTDNGCINVHACNRDDSPCGLWVKADRRSIARHGQRWHADARDGGDRKITCPWSGCTSQMRASAIPRHTLSVHFGATWTCRVCSRRFTRCDSFTAHSRRCGSLWATTTYDTSTRVINTRNVLEHYD